MANYDGVHVRDAMQALEDQPLESRLELARYKFNTSDYRGAANELVKTAALLNALEG